MTNYKNIVLHTDPLSSSRTFLLILTIIILACFSTSALAKTKYVTDKIILELHKTQSNLSTLLAQLPSGTPLIILDTDGASTKVEAPGNKIGWVDTAYLMSDKPATLLYTELMNEHKKTLETLAGLQNNSSTASGKNTKDIGWMKVELKKARNKARTLNANLAENNKKLDKALKSKKQQDSTITDLQARLDASTDENQETLDELNELSSKREALINPNGLDTEIPLLWTLIGAIIFLIAGLVGGAMLLDARNRRKHGGFRI